MYRKHFGLSRHPFSNEIATDELFPSAGAKELEARLGHFTKPSTSGSSFAIISLPLRVTRCRFTSLTDSIWPAPTFQSSTPLPSKLFSRPLRASLGKSISLPITL
jgi:hypothetical protein